MEPAVTMVYDGMVDQLMTWSQPVGGLVMGAYISDMADAGKDLAVTVCIKNTSDISSSYISPMICFASEAPWRVSIIKNGTETVILDSAAKTVLAEPVIQFIEAHEVNSFMLSLPASAVWDAKGAAQAVRISYPFGTTGIETPKSMDVRIDIPAARPQREAGR